ncbi:MAG TPA: hypothetical protein VEU50_01990, partial [Archangium sp.]|nr:hypothetical protein [Archangium sp.]
MHLKPRHPLRPLSPLLLSFALGCSGPAAEQDLHELQAYAEQGLSSLSGHSSPPWLAPLLVKDIHPSTGLTGNPGWKDSLVPGPAPVTLGSTTWFMAFEASTGYELWRTDGTPEGTRLVRELIPGPGPSGT